MSKAARTPLANPLAEALRRAIATEPDAAVRKWASQLLEDERKAKPTGSRSGNRNRRQKQEA